MFFRCIFVTFNRRSVFVKKFCTSQGVTNGHEEIRDQKCKELSALLGCSPSTAQLIIRRNQRITAISSDELVENVKFCKNSFRFKDIVEFPVILTFPTDILNQRYLTLREFGCNRVRPNYIINFMQIMQETPAALKKHGIFLHAKNVLQDILVDLKAPEEEKEKLHSKLSSMLSKNMHLFNIKSKMTAEFLMWRTQQRNSMAKIVRSHPILLCHSIKEIDSRIAILNEIYGFSMTEIIRRPFLLGVHIDRLKLFEFLPKIVGVSVLDLVRKCPSILRKSRNTVQKNADLLSKYGITEIQLRAMPQVLLLKPSMLEQRLSSLFNSEDICPLKSDKMFLKLVWFSSRIDKRLPLIKESQLQCSVSALTLSDSAFKRKLNSPMQSHVRGDEVLTHLCDMYKCSVDTVRQVLSRYPRHYTSVTNTYRVIDFLLCHGVSKMQLWNGLGIIAYDLKIVEDCFSQLPKMPELQPFSDSVRHFNFVQFLLYVVDRCVNSSVVTHSSVYRSAEQSFASEKLLDSVEVSEFHEDSYFNDDAALDSHYEASELGTMSDDEDELSDDEADAYVV